LAAAACAALYHRHFSASSARLKARRAVVVGKTDLVDLRHPDALIRSSSLAKLPRDLLRVPVAKDVFTEDLVNYYEHHDGKLALSGTLRRIAYENKLQLPERLLEMALDAPAEAALWNDGRGRLRHFAVAMTQNTLARTITLLLPLHTQVTSAGQWPGMDASILELSYGNQHLTLFTRGDRVVVVSDGLLPEAQVEAGGLSGRQQEIANIVKAMLAETSGQPSAFAQSFNLLGGLPEKGHEIVVAAKTLAFGYENFMPDLGGFHLFFDAEGNRQSDVLLNAEAATAQYTPLWRALPHGAAFCAVLPVDWAALSDVAAQWRGQSNATDARRIGDLLAKFGPAAVCWYGGSRLYTPLFAAAAQEPFSAEEKEELLQLSRAATKVVKPDESTSGSDGGMWRGSVPSAYGASTEGAEAAQSGKRFLHPAVAVWSFTAGQEEARDVALFSPDAALVNKVLGVAAKNFPALADDMSIPDGGQVIALINPGILAELIRGEILEAAPKDGADNFRDVAEFLFTPRLQALTRYPPQAVSFRAGKKFFDFSAAAWRWYPLRWASVGKAEAANATNTSAAEAEAAGEAIRP